MTPIIEVIKLLFDVGLEMFITIGSLYLILTALIVGVAYKFQLIPSTKEYRDNKTKLIVEDSTNGVGELIYLYTGDELISKPSTIENLNIVIKDNWAYEMSEFIVKERSKIEMIEYISEYLTNEITKAKDEREKQKHDDYRRNYLDGIIDMSNNILNQIDQQFIQTDNTNEEDVWKNKVDEKLDEMALSYVMTGDEVNKLYAFTETKLITHPNLFDDDYDVEDFIERTVIKIDPDKYGVCTIGAVVKVKDNLTIGETYGGIEFTKSMADYSGRTGLIVEPYLETTIDSGETINVFRLSIDLEDQLWTEEMLTVLQNP